MPIRADGNCAYHFAGTVFTLLHDPTFVREGRALCSWFEIGTARQHTEGNFLAWKEDCGRKGLDFNLECLLVFGETPEGVVRRLQSTAEQGGIFELALCMRDLPVRVVILRAERLRSAQGTEETACEETHVFEVVPPEFVVCAVMTDDYGHFEMGAVGDPVQGACRALFPLADWPAARSQIVQFVRQHSVSAGRWAVPSSAGKRKTAP